MATKEALEPHEGVIASPLNNLALLYHRLQGHMCATLHLYGDNEQIIVSWR